MEFGRQENRDSGGWGVSPPKETGVFALCSPLALSPAHVQALAPCATAPRPDRSTLQNSEDDVKPQSH